MKTQIISAAVALLINSSSALQDDSIYGANGISGPAPCLKEYAIDNSGPATGEDQHFVHGFESKDGAGVTAGSGFELRAGGKGRVALAIKQGQWRTQLGAKELTAEANWGAESPDGSYVIIGGFLENAAKSTDMVLWKLDSKTGKVLWEMTYQDAKKAGDAVESVAFAPDGGLIVGGFVAGGAKASELKFKSAGQPEEGTPFVGKISAADVNGAKAPTKFEWTFTKNDDTQIKNEENQYRGSTKSMRIAQDGTIYALSGYRTTVNKLDQKGNLIKCSGQLDFAFQSSDLELTPDGGLIIAGLTGGDPYRPETNLMRKEAHIVKYDSDFKEIWKGNYGDFPGGSNQYTGMKSDPALVIDECWGVASMKAADGSHDGYAIACGTGIENCTDPMSPETKARCDKDPRINWRNLVIAFSEEGQPKWARMDNHQGIDPKPADPTKPNKVSSSAAEYIFLKKDGSLGVITDETYGMGFMTIAQPNGQQCPTVPQYFGQKGNHFVQGDYVEPAEGTEEEGLA